MNSTEAWALYQAILDVEKYDRVIREYEEMGISGTVHDLEHRQMRKESIKVLQAHLPHRQARECIKRQKFKINSLNNRIEILESCLSRVVDAADRIKCVGGSPSVASEFYDAIKVSKYLLGIES